MEHQADGSEQWMVLDDPNYLCEPLSDSEFAARFSGVHAQHLDEGRAGPLGRQSALNFGWDFALEEQLELRPEVMQVPLQRVVQRAACADQPLAMVDQQPNIKLRACQLGRRQRLDPLGQRGPSDRERVDAIGLTPLTTRPPRVGHSRAGTRTTRSPRAIKNRSKEPNTCRQSSSAYTRSAPSPRPKSSTSPNPRPHPGGLIAEHLTRRCGNARDGVRALVHVRAEHDHQAQSLLLAVEVDSRPTRLASGAATLLSSHAGHPRPATSDTTKGSQAPPGRQPQRDSARRPVGTFSTASDVTDRRIETASLEAAARALSSGSSRSYRSGLPVAAPLHFGRQ